MSVRQGREVSAYLGSLDLPWNGPWKRGPVVRQSSGKTINLPHGAMIIILSPTKKELSNLELHWRQELSRRQSGEGGLSSRDPENRLATQARERSDVVVIHHAADLSWAKKIRAGVSRVAEVPERWKFLYEPDGIAGPRATQGLRTALERATFALVLVSRDLHENSGMTKLIVTELKNAAERGVVWRWVLLEWPAWKRSPFGQPMRLPFVPLHSEGLRELNDQVIDAEIDKLVKTIEGINAIPTARREPPTSRMDIEALANMRFVDDKSVSNASSISFLMEYRDRRLLVGGDARADVLCNSIRSLLEASKKSRLRVDAFVVPHAGSQRNTSRELLELLECDRYLISTSSDKFLHPARETIARIITYGRATPDTRPTLVFNYRTKMTEMWDDKKLQERYRFHAVYPDPGEAGIKVHV